MSEEMSLLETSARLMEEAKQAVLATLRNTLRRYGNLVKVHGRAPEAIGALIASGEIVIDTKKHVMRLAE